MPQVECRKRKQQALIKFKLQNITQLNFLLRVSKVTKFKYSMFSKKNQMHLKVTTFPIVNSSLKTLESDVCIKKVWKSTYIYKITGYNKQKK